MRHLLIPPLFLFLIICGAVSADTIYLKDGQEVKGVIVEDYHDRIIISTEKGEIGTAKKDIEKISYSDLADNFVKLGAYYKDKGDYKTALYYYEAAYKIAPDMKEAREGSLLVNSLLFNKKESDLAEQVRLRQDTEEKLGVQAGNEDISQSAILGKKAQEILNRTGLSVQILGNDIAVKEVLRGSPAREAGVDKGDIIVSVWGKLLRYMQIKDVYDLFLKGSSNEIKLVVSREIKVLLKRNGFFKGSEDMIGARLVMELEGLTVKEVMPQGPFDKAGVLKGDRITRIGDSPTRYISLEAVCETIEKTQADSLIFEIQRELSFWRE